MHDSCENLKYTIAIGDVDPPRKMVIIIYNSEGIAIIIIDYSARQWVAILLLPICNYSSTYNYCNWCNRSSNNNLQVKCVYTVFGILHLVNTVTSYNFSTI